jgi:transcription antitermination factor NusG
MLPPDYHRLRWYAAYTCANHEKRVAQQLERRSVEYFLPLYQSRRRWKDRYVRLRLPLFPSYVFVRSSQKDRLRVLEIPSVVRLVGFNGLPTALPDDQMEAMRGALTGKLGAEPCPYLKVGRRVRIKSGPFMDLNGILLRKKGTFRVILSIELIKRSIAVDVDAGDVVPIT